MQDKGLKTDEGVALSWKAPLASIRWLFAKVIYDLNDASAEAMLTVMEDAAAKLRAVAGERPE